MAFRFKEILEELSPYSGKCEDSKMNRRFCMRCIRRYSSRNGGDFTGHWITIANSQCITAPRDLLKIQKVRVGGVVSRNYSYWYKFYDSVNDQNGFIEAISGVIRQPGFFPVVFDPPRPGFRLGAQALTEENNSSHFIVSGMDTNNREVFRNINGQTVNGSYLSIIKEDKENKPKLTRDKFNKLTDLFKTETNNIVRLMYMYEDTGEVFLAGEYLPHETVPRFSRYTISACPINQAVEVEIIGTIKIPDMYNDYEIVPIDDLDALHIIAQEIKHENNNELNAAQYKNLLSKETIQKDNNRKEEGNEGLDFVVSLFTIDDGEM
jgi:hypothetical protein